MANGVCMHLAANIFKSQARAPARLAGCAQPKHSIYMPNWNTVHNNYFMTSAANLQVYLCSIFRLFAIFLQLVLSPGKIIPFFRAVFSLETASNPLKTCFLPLCARLLAWHCSLVNTKVKNELVYVKPSPILLSCCLHHENTNYHSHLNLFSSFCWRSRATFVNLKKEFGNYIQFITAYRVAWNGANFCVKRAVTIISIIFIRGFCISQDLTSRDVFALIIEYYCLIRSFWVFAH